MQSKTLVKTWMMRGTIHLLDATDLPAWAAASVTRQTWQKAYWQKAFGLTAKDVQDALDAIDAVIDDEPLTRDALANEVHSKTKNKALDDLMRHGWGSILKIAASQGRLCFGSNVGRNVTFVRPETWLPSWRKVSVEEGLAEVCPRYLASHGPATREEFARWWGFRPPDARAALEALGDEIVPVDRQGDKAYLLARDVGALRDASEDDRVRMLGMFDAYTLAGLPHDQIVPKGDKDRVYRKGAWVSQVVMQGGRIIGTWTHERKAKGTAVEVSLFRNMKIRNRAIEEALDALQPFLGKIVSLSV